ncbi:GroES-like protein [Hortaea werneckii]|nr:GroES-like protein [Hortaea werneckii]KAI6991749.1 GroES-like protein [Hortaea werneckii]KAI7144354.1 GroES-like protein [Hortaea werneckii]KAI7172503.1 GroES-like protein [Hortaea werneckii]
MHRLTTFYYDSDTDRFEQKTTEKKLGVKDVLIATTHSGLCFTDVHAKGKGCGLGHEGVGIVRDAGEAVTHLRIGDRVGWGWLNSSCGHCKTCVSCYRQYCSEARGFAFSDLDQGAFSDYRVINSAFAYLIPESIPSVDAGPLMCAGASVFEALDAAGTRSDHRVGIVGLGGLGHAGVLFAKAMGCDVTVFSSSTQKMEDSFDLGANDYRSLQQISKCFLKSDGGGLSTVEDPAPMNIDVLLITSNEVPNLETILPCLARRATIVLMTIQQGNLSIPYMPFILPGHKLIASTEASRENHLRMLDFVARHKIRPWTEEFPMTSEGVSKAFKRLESGEMRYRGVLVRPDAA